MTKQTIETDIYAQLIHLITLSDTYHHYITLNQQKPCLLYTSPSPRD